MSLLLKQIPDLPEANSISNSDLIHIRNGSVDKKITFEKLIGGHVNNKNNPHEVTKAQLGLDNLTGNAVLEQAKNLSDVPDKAMGRANLGVPSIADLASATPRGVIVDWYGDLSNVPTGWQACDGTNGTPNLMGRLTVGATIGGKFPVKSTGGALTVDHTHGLSILGHSLTAQEIPAHSHVAAYSERSRNPPFGIEPSAGRNNMGSGDTDYDNYRYLNSPYFYDSNGVKVTGAANSHNHQGSTSVSQTSTLSPYMSLVKIMKL